MSERLEEIKMKFDLDRIRRFVDSKLISPQDLIYLIQQAERVEKLDYENKGLKHQSEQQGADIAVLEHENQRYKQALELVEEELEYAKITGNDVARDEYIKNSIRFIEEALKGESE